MSEGNSHSSGFSGPLKDIYACRPSPWREISDETRAHFAHEALKAAGPTTAATARLAEAVNAAAYAHDAGPLDYLRRRLAKALKAAFGQAITFLVALEEDTYVPGQPRVAHLHLELGFDPLDQRGLAKVRAAIRTACGAWTGPRRRRQIMMRAVRNAGWAAYLSKDCRMSAPRMVSWLRSQGAGPRWLPGHAGPTLSMDNETRRAAKVLHEKARQIVWAARQGRSAPQVEGE